MKLKNENVNIKKLHEDITTVIGILERIAKKVINYEYEITITSGNDSKHMLKSLHYKNRAIDVRTRDMKEYEIKTIANMLRTELKELYKKNSYDVIIENNHLHIELNY